MSPDTQTDFLTPASPSFDIRQLAPKKKRPSSPLLFTLREMLTEQPPLSPTERLPRHLTLDRFEFALSTKPRQFYTYIKEIDLYIPDRHTLVSDAALKELNTPTQFPHGSIDTYKQNCTGPLCRRARREERAVIADLRRKRLAYETGGRHQSSRQLKSAPAYEAVDPLLLALTIISHQLTPPKNNLSRQQKLYCKIATLQQLHRLLQQLYPRLVE